MADLPTNYYEDILSASMNGKKKFRITYRNGTTEEVTIEDISEYDQYGSKFGAGDINKTNQAVNEKFDSDDVVDPMLATKEGFAADAYKTKLQFDEQNKKLPFKFGVDDNGNYGYIKDGADTVTPFKNLSDTTAVASQVTSGYIFYDKDGNRCVGTRPKAVTRQSGTSTGYISKGNPNTTYTYDQIINFGSAFDTVPTVSVSLVSATAGQDGGSVFGDTSVSVVERQRTYFKARVSCIATQYGGTNFKYNWSAQA